MDACGGKCEVWKFKSEWWKKLVEGSCSPVSSTAQAASKQARFGWQSADQAQLSQTPEPERGASAERRKGCVIPSIPSGDRIRGLARLDVSCCK